MGIPILLRRHFISRRPRCNPPLAWPGFEPWDSKPGVLLTSFFNTWTLTNRPSWSRNWIRELMTSGYFLRKCFLGLISCFRRVLCHRIVTKMVVYGTHNFNKMMKSYFIKWPPHRNGSSVAHNCQQNEEIALYNMGTPPRLSQSFISTIDNIELDDRYVRPWWLQEPSDGDTCSIDLPWLRVGATYRQSPSPRRAIVAENGHPPGKRNLNGHMKHYDNKKSSSSALILGLRPANERRRYKVTPSPIGLAQT